MVKCDGGGVLASKIQSIKFLYNELRQVVKLEPYHAIVITRTFDAIDNAVKTLYNAQQVVSSGSSNPLRFTYYFPVLAVNQDTSHNFIPNLSTQPSRKITDIVINAKVPSTTGDVLIDIQYSLDDVTWNTLLNTFVKLPINLSFAGPYSSISSGPLIIPGSFVRAIVAPGSDVNATNVQVEMDTVSV